MELNIEESKKISLFGLKLKVLTSEKEFIGKFYYKDNNNKFIILKQENNNFVLINIDYVDKFEIIQYDDIIESLNNILTNIDYENNIKESKFIVDNIKYLPFNKKGEDIFNKIKRIFRNCYWNGSKIIIKDIEAEVVPPYDENSIIFLKNKSKILINIIKNKNK